MRGYPKPLCILFPDTKGIQWVDTDATVVCMRIQIDHTMKSGFMHNISQPFFHQSHLFVENA